MTPTLTALETKVFDALKQNAEDESGGDFAITERVNYKALGLSATQFGALLTTLQTKSWIYVSVTYVNGSFPGERGPRGTKVTQVGFLV